MSDKEDYLTAYRVFFENFAATVNPEDQLPVNIAGYTITEAELPGEVLSWTNQYLTEKQCPPALMTPLQRIILDEVRVASKKQPNEFGYKSDESVYIALRLMQAVTARVNAVCLRYLDNSRLDSLPPPPALAHHELKTVSCATKNSRRVMEDRHVEIGNLEALFGIETTEPTSFYAVYDGHAGSAAAMYCAAHLHQYLVESPHFSTDLRRAMRDAFLRTDTEFVRKSNQERACGGSTAVAVAVRARRLLAAWAGDSLALLAKRMRLMQLVRPHKPGRQDERDRIESSGGTVMYWGTWRVNGQLAVSRAIGDAQYKPYVTAKPEIATVELDGDEDFVVVACDGLWDFVSEDDVALAVYRQIASDPDDLKAVTKLLVVLAKRQGSADNISIIVVFLKDPRDIAADNCPPMDLGLDNALANVPPFAMETEACKRLSAAAAEAESGECADAGAEADNGIDNSDSDSEDLGPETAVDADDLDAEARNHNPAPPTPPAHIMETSHVDGALVDNVAESGEESEDEWNYVKGERERDDETDEPPRSETPCQDNSAWETSSVDMNSSPLNPDAPVFVPGTVAGSDVLLAESPRKPVPMDDIELPDVAQFQTEAVVRPAELLDLDNCDQLNGHHNVSIDDAVKDQFNGNEKCNLDSLGFGFSVGIEPEKLNDSGLIQDFERIQKDTTDFCNIQVFQTHTETNPFAAEGTEELLERLKNKERDPMNMSFYQEKDDDTCERLSQEPAVDLNAVQPLPDSDDEELQSDGSEKENIRPHSDPLAPAEPDNDLLGFHDRAELLSNNLADFGHGDFLDNFATRVNNMQTYSNIEFDSSNVPQDVAQTDTPESHKLLFEQIPEIPDGKSSELGFANEDVHDPSESEKDARVVTPQEEMSQDVEMESKFEESPSEETQPELKEEHIDVRPSNTEPVTSPEPITLDKENEIITEAVHNAVDEKLFEQSRMSPAPVQEEKPAEAISPEVAHDIQEHIFVDVHSEPQGHFDSEICEFGEEVRSGEPLDAPHIQQECELSAEALAECPLPAASPLPAHSPLPSESPAPELAESPIPPQMAESPVPPQPTESPVPPQPTESPAPPQLAESPVPQQPAESPVPSQPAESPVPPQRTESLASTQLPLPSESPAPSPLPAEVPLPRESPLPAESLAPVELAPSPTPEPAIRPETASPLSEASERLTPSAPPEEPHVPEPTGPAPDIVPEEPSRSDLVTDIDIGIPESRAQEICVPVTSEIQLEEGVLPAATPPPAPAAPPAEPPPALHAPLLDTPIAADIEAPAPAEPALLAAAAATAAVAAAAAVTIAKSKTPSSATKKTPSTQKADARTLKATPKTSTATRTPTSAKKPAPVTSKPVAKSPAVSKATPPPAAKPPPITRTTPAKPSAPKSSSAPVKAAIPVTKTAPVKEVAAVAKAAPVSRAAATARPAPKTTTARPAAAAPARPAAASARPASAPARPAAASSRPATAPVRPVTVASAPKPGPRPATTRPAPATAATRPKPLEKKPLPNGDVKAAAKPAPKPLAARPAPRPPPRGPAAPSATAPPRSAPVAPRPAPRAAPPRAPSKDTDKQSKDLANKRITAKAAPPRTAATKAPPSTKSVPKAVPKRAMLEAQKELNGLANGAAESETAKPPPSPPAADNALLPDVIA